MSEGGAKIRLVRCPRCEKLLPELTDYPVYRCGGCDATLRASKNRAGEEALSEKFDEHFDGYVDSEMNLIKADKKNELNAPGECVKTLSQIPNLENSPTGSSLSSGVEDSSSHRQNDIASKNKKISNSKDPIHNQGSEKTPIMYPKEQGKKESKIEKESHSHGKTETRTRCGKFQSFPNWTPKTSVKGTRYCPYPDEGTSSFHPQSTINHCKMNMTQNTATNLNVGCPEEDPTEILRKLDCLREQLIRSCGVLDKIGDPMLPSRGNTPNSSSCIPPLAEGLSTSNSVSALPCRSIGGHIHRPPCREPLPFSYVKNDPFDPGMTGRDAYYPQYPNRPSSDFLQRQYMEMDPCSFHEHSSSCNYCHRDTWQEPISSTNAFLCNRGLSNSKNCPTLYRVEEPHSFDSHFCRKDFNYPFHPFYSDHNVSSANLTDRRDLGKFRSQTCFLRKGSGHRCRPVVGGAPYITCYNCFELLQLPEKLEPKERILYRLQCGKCSTVVSFAITDKGLVLSVPEVDYACNYRRTKPHHPHGYMYQFDVDSEMEDYENSSSDVYSVDWKPYSPALSNYSAKENKPGMLELSSSSSSSEEEEDQPNKVAERNDLDSTELDSRTDLSPDHLKNLNHSVYKYEKGSKSARSEQGKVQKECIVKQTSLKDVGVVTEMELSFADYTNPGVCRDTTEIIKESTVRTRSISDSFFAGFIKKSFKDFTKSNQVLDHGNMNVSVNGHVIPHRLVKKAEKLAGPIHPGHYWYDFRAGFWGILGQPCLGIIPPSIGEFNYPIPKNCSGGNTGVFVNGRELHQKDLDLLVSRGLPKTRDKHYILEISGHVMDEISGEELDCLGKLAPTIEKVKRGFGMRVPRAEA